MGWSLLWHVGFRGVVMIRGVREGDFFLGQIGSLQILTGLSIFESHSSSSLVGQDSRNGKRLGRRV